MQQFLDEILWPDIIKPGLATRGYIPSNILLLLAIIFLISTCYTLKKNKKESRLITALGKYSSRMFILTILYYFLKNIDSWLEQSLEYIKWQSYKPLATIFIQNFRGSNYAYFFKYFIDGYWIACFLLLFPCLYYRNFKKAFFQDKYVSLLKSFFSIFGIFKKQPLYWSKLSSLGLLSIAIKLFYIPYLTSWVINNTIHQKNLIASFNWDFHVINSFLVALFIYIDTSVFAFAYIVESKLLKSEIKTVEPTILGWVVCLWCYPPFNQFSYIIFNFQLIDISHKYPRWVDSLMTCLITLLWAIFVWASIALGFKASNLTNRGIVASGPYRFIRHPAYTSKLLVWLIEGIFFGKYILGLLIGLVIIYVLRALTEERHLSMDPDYGRYKKKVPYLFIPYLL